MSSATCVSVIVPAFEAAQSIGACVESVLSQTGLGAEFEVIVVDNGSTDGTLERALRYPVRTVVEARRGRSRARNLGARLARGDYLAFIDVDCEAPPDWLSASLASLTRPWIGAVQARVQKPGFAPTPLEFTQAYYYRPFLDTCAMVTTREAFQNAHGFDEELRRTVDMDYSFRLLSCGYAFAWLPRVVMTKHHELTSRQILRRGWDGGTSLSVLARKWQKLNPQPPATLWRDRALALARSLLNDARRPLATRGKNALEASTKALAAAVADLSGGSVAIGEYELATRLHEVLGPRASLVLSEEGGLVFDAGRSRLHRLNRPESLALVGLIDGAEEARTVAHVVGDAGCSEAGARASLAAARGLSEQLRHAS